MGKIFLYIFNTYNFLKRFKVEMDSELRFPEFEINVTITP